MKHNKKAEMIFDMETSIEVRREALQMVYEDLKEGDPFYLSGYDTEFSLYLMYEALIVFMLVEEYEKCATIRDTIDKHFCNKKYFIPW